MVEPTKAKEPMRENAELPRPDVADKNKLAPNDAAAEPEADQAE